MDQMTPQSAPYVGSAVYSECEMQNIVRFSLTIVISSFRIFFPRNWSFFFSRSVYC